jgi:hypothetical protein
MTDGGTIREQPMGPNGATQAEQMEDRREALEQRVRRLEDAVATLQDSRALEERVVERVSKRLKRDSAAEIPESGRVLNAGRQLLPAALNLIRTKAAEADQESAGTPSLGALTQPRSPLRPWILFEAYAELRTIVRMFLDHRYRMTWPARVVPLALLALILTSWIWLPGTMILPTSLMTIVDKVIDLVLAFLAFKILVREARRYRELVIDLPSPRADR